MKTHPKYINALERMLVEVKAISNDDKVSNIVIGLAFGASRGVSTTWSPADVDFIFRISDRNKWQIGIFNPELLKTISVISGDTDFPIIYECCAPTLTNDVDTPTIF